MGSLSELLQTPLNAEHRRLGARMVDFAGWDMPVQYASGILAEHQAVRERCGLFDLSHMGRVHLRGREALALAQACCTRDLTAIPNGTAGYGLLCSEAGGIVDDIIAYVLHEREIVFVFNASNRLSDTDFCTRERDRLALDAEVLDLTFQTALIGVQGPASQDVLQRHCSIDLEPLAGYAFTQGDVAGEWGMIARTGYTGEDGFELVLQADAAAHVWSVLTDEVTPCGLGARDTLRTEAGFALYGHEIDASTNPYEARLGWVVNLGKEDFVGRAALQQIKSAGTARRLVGLRVAPGGIPRAGATILRDGAYVGRVTSGTFSPTLKQNIAMGYVPTEFSAVGEAFEIEVRGRAVKAESTKLPFVPHRSRPRATM
jgi:glycine cleavage system T protein (aminomethyltransferase)